jgi:hypothetical protein
MALRSDPVSNVFFRSLFLGLGLALVMAVSIPAAAQDDPSGEPADEVEVFDENESEATVEWVTRALVGIAAGTGLLLVGYIWHTSPRRRLRVATRRREDREASRRVGLEDEFVLPVELDEDSGVVGEWMDPVESRPNED